MFKLDVDCHQLNQKGSTVETFTTKTQDKTLCQWLTQSKQATVKPISQLPCWTGIVANQNLDPRLVELTKRTQQCLLTMMRLLKKLPVLAEANARSENKQTDQKTIYVALQTAVIQLEKMMAHEVARLPSSAKEIEDCSLEAFSQH